MRNAVTEARFDDFLGKQAQRPASMTFRSITTGERSDLSALGAVNGDGTTRAWGIVQAGKTRGEVLVAPGGNGDDGGGEGRGNVGECFAAVEFEQGGGTFEGFDGK